MLNIVKDIRSGALPAREIPAFVVWALGKTFWAWMLILAIGLIVVTR